LNHEDHEEKNKTRSLRRTFLREELGFSNV